jgi:hypothetical protein
MGRDLRRGAILSAAVHLGIVVLLLIGIPATRPPEEPPETAVAMMFAGTAELAPHAAAPAAVPAPAPAPEVTPAPQAQEQPRPQPIEAAPPPPPPPPPPSAPPAIATPLPTPPLPVPPPPLPAPPSAPSTTAQPNPTKNPAPQSTALENTLERLRSLERQAQPPRARYNPQSGGAPNGGGSPQSDDTSALSAAQRGAIGEFVRRCWTTDPGMLDLDKMEVLLTVTTDGGGVVRRAVVAPQDEGRVGANMRLRIFSERAVRAVMDPNCANLPLPPALLGQTRVFTFRFRP